MENSMAGAHGSTKMNYVPFVCYGLCPGGTTTEVSNYFSSYGLIGALASGGITLFLRKLLGVGI